MVDELSARLDAARDRIVGLLGVVGLQRGISLEALVVHLALVQLLLELHHIGEVLPPAVDRRTLQIVAVLLFLLALVVHEDFIARVGALGQDRVALDLVLQVESIRGIVAEVVKLVGSLLDVVLFLAIQELLERCFVLA